VTDPEKIWRQYPNPKEPVQRPSNEDAIVLLVTHFEGDGADEQSASKKTKLIDVLPQVPVPHCALRARIWMLYQERHVERGHEYYDESKQSVTLLRDAEDKRDVDIMSADEVSPAVWSIRLCKEPQCTGEDVLRAKVQPSISGLQNASLGWKVVFTDYGAAVRLIHWLRTHQPEQQRDTGYKFNYPGDIATPYVSLVPVKNNDDDCTKVASITAAIRAYSKRVAARRLGGQRYANAGGQTMSRQ
jgi:hypothetical protein